MGKRGPGRSLRQFTTVYDILPLPLTFGYRLLRIETVNSARIGREHSRATAIERHGVPLTMLLALSMAIGAFGSSLDLVSFDSNRVLTVRVHGDDSVPYSAETSTNLSSWEESSSLRTTNGIALFALQLHAEDRLYVRVHETTPVPVIVLGPESANL